MAYFKYKNITDVLRQQILMGLYPSGQKIPTEIVLCEEFSVSRRTIRAALSALEDEGFLIIKQGSGAYVTEWGQRESLDGISMTKNIALILTDVDTYIYPAVLKGINSELLKSNHNLTLRITDNSLFQEANVIESLLETDVDAIILDPTKAALTDINHPLYRRMAEKVPCVTMYTKLLGLDIPSITLSDLLCFSKITEHVISRGHTKIAGVFVYDEMSGTERFKGMVQTARLANITLEERSILWLSRAQQYQTEVERLLNVFLDKNEDRTAFLCINDRVASLLIHCLKMRGKQVPQDVSVTGFDDAPIVGSHITGVAHPQEEMGILAARAVLELLINPKAKVEYVFPPLLIDKGSVGYVSAIESNKNRQYADFLDE